jgi:hypothetical protein
LRIDLGRANLNQKTFQKPATSLKFCFWFVLEFSG